MEIFTSAVVLSLFVLAIFMYFKTRERPKTAVHDLDESGFRPIADPEVAARVRSAAKPALLPAVAAGLDGSEPCLTDGSRYLFTVKPASSAPGTKVLVLLDQSFAVLGVRRSIRA